MSHRVVEHETAASKRRIPRRDSLSAPSAGQQLLALQRTAGNAAVAQLLRNGPAPAPGVKAPSPPSPKEQGDKLLKEFAAKFPDAAKLVVGHASAEQLVQEAAVKGVKFGGYSEEGPAKAAWAYTVGDSVYVPKARTDAIVAMSDFLFELNNAIHAPLIEGAVKEAAAKKIDAKTYARRIVEIEVEGMLRMGLVWLEIKGGDKKLDKYDKDFFAAQYKDFKDGKKTKKEIVDAVLTWKNGIKRSKTNEQYYMDQYPK